MLSANTAAPSAGAHATSLAVRVPQSIEEITAEWVGEALRAGGLTDLPDAAAVHTRTIGAERGFLSVTLQVHNDYASAPPNGAPVSLVAKIEPARGNFRDAERRYGAFDREIRFYRERGRPCAGAAAAENL